MVRQRLDQRLVELGLVRTRSQAESYIKLGKVVADGRVTVKPGQLVTPNAKLTVTVAEQYVSRAALKLASVSDIFALRFQDALVLDVGSSTGGFTEFALRHGAQKVIAVDVGTDQLHVTLRVDPRVELFEKTDIRNVRLRSNDAKVDSQAAVTIARAPDIVLADVSFISLREILPAIARLCGPTTQIVSMVKPQFETQRQSLAPNGVVKNDALRRKIIKDFETWLQSRFYIVNKADSAVSGMKGNRERFYLLRLLPMRSEVARG